VIEVPLLCDSHTPTIANSAKTNEDLKTSDAAALAIATVLCLALIYQVPGEG